MTERSSGLSRRATTTRGPETICASTASLEKRHDDSSFSAAVEWAAVSRAARRSVWWRWAGAPQLMTTRGMPRES
jgi:hypothetical protein